MIRRPPRSPLFPSPTLFRSVLHEASHYVCMTAERRAGLDRDAGGSDLEEAAVCYLQVLLAGQDRKSTRLNSSHLVISYAVFCLKKKKKSTRMTPSND